MALTEHFYKEKIFRIHIRIRKDTYETVEMAFKNFVKTKKNFMIRIL